MQYELMQYVYTRKIAMPGLNVAVIGTGFIGPVHVEALRRAGQNVVGMLGSSHSKSKAACEQLSIPNAYENLDALIADSQVQSVHITSPNQAHFDQAMRCVASGKHVLCEKPLAMDSQQSAQLVSLAERAKVATGVNYNIRYYPLCLEAARRVRHGSLGRIIHVSGSYTQDWLFHPTDFNWRVLSQEGGRLRALADIGTHWLDLMQFVAGEKITQVFADLLTVHPERQPPTGTSETFSAKLNREPQVATQGVKIDTEDYGAVMLRFASGAKGLMHVSQVMAGRKNSCRFEIAGTRQSLEWNSEQPNEMGLGNRDRANERLIRDPALMLEQAARFASYPAGHNEGFPDTFKQLFVDFYESIESESFRTQPTYPTFADGHREILLCEAILRSATGQSWQGVELVT